MRQKIIVCAEIYDGLLAELPSRSPVDTAIDSDDDTMLALAVVTDNLKGVSEQRSHRRRKM